MNMDTVDIIFLGSNSSNFIHYVINIKSIIDDYIKYANQMNLVFYFKNINNNLTRPPDKQFNYDKIMIKYTGNNNKDFLLDFGKINTIIGKNGCGKTSMVLSLLGLNNITNWSLYGISSDMSNWKKIDHIGARDIITIVFQEPYLFDRTVLDNIVYGTNATLDDVYIIAHKINLYRWVKLNYNRQIGKNGDNLSGGEKKKIQLMNALLQNKNIFIFDEPTNNLDTDTREWYIKLIKEMAKSGKMIILITHDDFLINSSDLLIELNNTRDIMPFSLKK
jgi:ABC-type transport system involved in cytochrome bd biosynthesis fused ATPase/permease subunit